MDCMRVPYKDVLQPSYTAPFFEQACCPALALPGLLGGALYVNKLVALRPSYRAFESAN